MNKGESTEKYVRLAYKNPYDTIAINSLRCHLVAL